MLNNFLIDLKLYFCKLFSPICSFVFWINIVKNSFF